MALVTAFLMFQVLPTVTGTGLPAAAAAAIWKKVFKFIVYI
jgi:hypothetical protein